MTNLNIVFIPRKILLLLLIFILSLLPSKLRPEIELLDRVIAVVESGVIMESELNSRLQEVIGRIRETGSELPPKKILEEQVLERLIMEEIQLQIGERAGIKISDAELNSSLSKIASQNSLNLENFKDSLESQNISYRDLRETVKKNMIIQRVQRGKVGSKIDITNEEIENFLNSEEGKTKLAEEYSVQQILLPLKGNSTKEEIKKAETKGKSIIKKLLSGESFSKLAASYSSGQNALEGGSLGWKKSSELPTLFSEIILKMEVGDISKLIRSGAGFHILHLSEKRGDTVKFEDQTLVRHILLKSTEIRTSSQTKDLIQEIYNNLKNGDDFKDLARDFSEDPGSKLDGGDLGWNTPSTFDPIFAEVINKTDINEISEPFKSSFGWHVLEVLGRRNEDVSESVRKNRAYQIIFTRKYEQELQRTLVELRSEAFVDIKLAS